MTNPTWPRAAPGPRCGWPPPTWRSSRRSTSAVPDLFLFGFFTAVLRKLIRSAPDAMILLRYVAAYNLFDALNLVFVNAIKGAGDTQFVFGVSLAMAGALVAVDLVGDGLFRCRPAWLLESDHALGLGVGHDLPGSLPGGQLAVDAGDRATGGRRRDVVLCQSRGFWVGGPIRRALQGIPASFQPKTWLGSSARVFASSGGRVPAPPCPPTRMAVR